MKFFRAKISAGYRWQCNGGYSIENACAENLLKLELPLLDNGFRSLGHLRLVKDLNRDPISHYTLRRIEHLRRSVMGTLRNLIRFELVSCELRVFTAHQLHQAETDSRWETHHRRQSAFWGTGFHHPNRSLQIRSDHHR